MKKLSFKNMLPERRKKDENEARIKLWFQQWFEDEDINWRNWELHLILVKTTKSDITITITLGCPGLLIGKGGETIDKITKHLSDWLEKPVKIKIVEYKVFYS